MTSWQVKSLYISRRLKVYFLRYDKIDMKMAVQINLGPNVGDITICVNRPGGAGLRKGGLTRKKPRTQHENGGSIKGLKPTGDWRPVVVNRHNGMTCIVR